MIKLCSRNRFCLFKFKTNIQVFWTKHFVKCALIRDRLDIFFYPDSRDAGLSCGKNRAKLDGKQTFRACKNNDYDIIGVRYTYVFNSPEWLIIWQRFPLPMEVLVEPTNWGTRIFWDCPIKNVVSRDWAFFMNRTYLSPW